MNFLTLWYKFLYGLGVTPWEEDPTQGIAAGQISELRQNGYSINCEIKI